MIRGAGVVIPVHNEVELLPRCLRAVRVAADAAGVDVHVVVLDGCTDGSDALVMAEGPLGKTTDVIQVDQTSVGAARDAGCDLLPQRYGVPGWWLATTDADSAVGSLWLRTQLRYARAGYDDVAGTVTVDDWTSFGAEARRTYGLSYPWPPIGGVRRVANPWLTPQ